MRFGLAKFTKICHKLIIWIHSRQQGDDQIPRPMEEGGSGSDSENVSFKTISVALIKTLFSFYFVQENITRSLEQLELEADHYAYISSILNDLQTLDEGATAEYFRLNPLVANLVALFVEATFDKNAQSTEPHEEAPPPPPQLFTRRLAKNVLHSPYALSGLAEFFGENTANEIIEEMAADVLSDDPNITTAKSLGKRRAIDELKLSSQKRARHDDWKLEFENSQRAFQNPETRDFWLQAGFIRHTKDFGAPDEPLTDEPLPNEPPPQSLDELYEEIAGLIDPQVFAIDISEAFVNAYWAANTETRAEITTWTEHYLGLSANTSNNHQQPDVFLMTALRDALLCFANLDHDSQTCILALLQRCIPNLAVIYLLILEMVMDADPQNL